MIGCVLTCVWRLPQWTAIYGRDVADERRKHTNAFKLLSRRLAPVLYSMLVVMGVSAVHDTDFSYATHFSKNI